ncbi:RecQ family ATP-dependent DNA helicase [Treponema sp.]|uniref:RecQ family ATP-dependent DNA helicase n=1 Tax=Treponema sp. TaxID=166 RepID=UPI003F0E366F
MNYTLFDRTPEDILKSVFGYENFRPLQRKIIQNVLDGRDTLAIMPTGGGKSLCYEIPSLILPGLTIVVSPLISLMQDQAAQLESYGIPVVCLNSSLDWNSYSECCRKITSGKVKIVYVSPEGLNTDRIIRLLQNSKYPVECIAIDEAHCISEWGHDFRPDYMEIMHIRKMFPKSVFLALTATATRQVQHDIIKNLGMENPEIFTASFNRPNIFLQVAKKDNPEMQVLDFIEKHPDKSGIIYCFSRKQVDKLVQELRLNGIKALSYHAGLTDEARMKNQRDFISDKVNIIVATVAFGMGINKPDVRFVIHFDMPKSIEQYYQEIGRAGRDGLEAEALLLYSKSDIHKIRYFFKENFDSAKSEKLLQGMINFCERNVCRRQTLLSYFGESYSIARDDAVSSEECCDVCASIKNSRIAPAAVLHKKIQSFPKPSKKNSGELLISSTTESQGKLAEKLRAWRKNAAEELHVPPYIIFGDKTLFDIAKKKPASIKELTGCYGIGETKAEKFGYFILKIIKEAE